MSSDKNMSLFHYQTRSNQVAHITHICLAAHAVAEKLQALALWRVHLIAKKAQPQIHAANVNRVMI
jgi:hypothetical protein